MNRCFIEAEHYRIIEAMLDKFKEYLRGEEPGFLDDAPTDKQYSTKMKYHFRQLELSLLEAIAAESHLQCGAPCLPIPIEEALPKTQSKSETQKQPEFSFQSVREQEESRQDILIKTRAQEERQDGLALQANFAGVADCLVAFMTQGMVTLDNLERIMRKDPANVSYEQFKINIDYMFNELFYRITCLYRRNYLDVKDQHWDPRKVKAGELIVEALYPLRPLFSQTVGPAEISRIVKEVKPALGIIIELASSLPSL